MTEVETPQAKRTAMKRARYRSLAFHLPVPRCRRRESGRQDFQVGLASNAKRLPRTWTIATTIRIPPERILTFFSMTATDNNTCSLPVPIQHVRHKPTGWLAGWAVAGRARATHAVEKVRIVDRCHRFSDDFGSQSQLNAACEWCSTLSHLL